MPYTSPFSSRKAVSAPAGNSGQPLVRTNWRGLDLTSPYDEVEDFRSPNARNFRIYAQESDDRKVSISSRKGSGFYTTPIGETQDAEEETTATGDEAFNITTRWLAVQFEAGVTGKLTKVELRLRNPSNDARGPVIVSIHDDADGVPGTKLAESGILPAQIDDSYSWVPVRFIEAPQVTDNSFYWIGVRIQDDGVGEYEWASVGSSGAVSSDSQGLSWTEEEFNLLYRTFVSDEDSVTGVTRYAPSNGANRTIVAIGTSIYEVDDNDGSTSAIITGLNENVKDTFFTFADDKVFIVNGYDDLMTWDGSVNDTITHVQLPTLRLAVFHKDRLFGVSADDPNKLVYSELPGNDDGAGNEWYNAWLSTSFRYVPTPKASDPITAIIPFQDNLYIFTAGGKYVLYGSDPGSFNMRMAMGKKGALSQKSVFADENFIYFASNDGLYRFNGSSDTRISERVQTEYDGIPDITKCLITKWKKGIRFNYQTPLSGVNNRTLIWHEDLEEWMLDTDSYVARAVAWTDSNDPQRLVEASSTGPFLTYAEQSWNNLGKQMDFYYECKSDSMGNPAIKKRIPKFYPLLEGNRTNYFALVGIDKDNRGEPRISEYTLNVAGEQVGDFEVGDGTLIGGIVSFQPRRVRVSGYGYYWQVSISRKAIENPVKFIGYVLSVRAKRL